MMKVPYNLLSRFDLPSVHEPELDDGAIELLYDKLMEMLSDFPVFISSLTVIGGKSVVFELHHSELYELDDVTLLNLMKDVPTLIRTSTGYYDVFFNGATLVVTYSRMDAALKLCETHL